MKKKIYILLSLIFLFSSCSTSNQSFKKREVATATVIKKDKKIESSFTSTVKPEKETILSAKTFGRVSFLPLEVGSIAKEGEVVAYLEGEEDSIRYKTAGELYSNAAENIGEIKDLMELKLENSKNSLETANRNLEALEKNKENIILTGENQIKVAQSNINIIENQIKSLKNTKEETLALLTKNKEKIGVSKENTISTKTQFEENIQENAITAITQATILANSTISFLYSINNENVSTSSFQVSNDFGHLSTKTRIDATKSIKSAKRLKDKLENFYNENIKHKTEIEDSVSLEGMEIAKETMEELKKALQDMNDTLLKTVPSNNISKEMLESYKKAVLGYGEKVENMTLGMTESGISSGILGVEQSKKNLDTEMKGNIKSIDKQIEILEQEYKKTQVEFDNQISQMQDRLGLAKKELELLKSNIKSQKEDIESNIEIAKARIKEAETQVETVQKNKSSELLNSESMVDSARGNMDLLYSISENNNIKSPYEAIITEKFVEEGSVVNIGSPILGIASNLDKKLVIFIPESEINNFSIGQKGFAKREDSEEIFEVEISKIYPETQGQSRRIKTELKISDPENTLKLGSFMTVNFENQVQNDLGKKVIAIPLESSFKYFGDDMVFTIKDGKANLVRIKLGEIFGKYVEVKSGLKENETIIIKGFNYLLDGEEVEVVDHIKY